MKRNLLSIRWVFIPLILFLCHTGFAQAVGDYGSSSATMNWNGGTWNVCVTAGTWAGATTTTTAPTAATNVWILTGHTVTLDGSAGNCANLNKVGNLVTNFNLTCTGNITGIGNQTGNGIVIMTGATKTIDNSPVTNLQINPGAGNTISTGSTAFNINGNMTITSGTFKLMGNLYYGANGTVAVPTQLTIASGATLTANGSTSYRWYVQGASTVITNNGVFGQATPYAADAGLFLNTRGNVLVTVTGTGVTNIRGIITDTYTTSCAITIDQSMHLSGSAEALSISDWGQTYPTATDTRSLTINAGKIVTMDYGWMHMNTTTQTNNQTPNTYNINGTLIATIGGVGLVTTSSATASSLGTTNSITLNIGSTGIVRCAQAIVYKIQSGQTITVNVATGGTIIYTGTSYTTNQGTGATALLTPANQNLQFTSAGVSLALNSNVSVGGNLTLAGATSLSGTGNLSVNGALTLAGKLTNNTGNLTLGSAATISGASASSYIDLSSGGSLTRQGVAATTTAFPIGNGSYSPLTFTNTTGAPAITAKVKPTIDNAVLDATKIVNLQWSITGNQAATSNIGFQFNTSDEASAFNTTATCDLGNYTTLWSAANVGTPAGSNPYTVVATGANIITANNLYVIGNTGQVVNNAPTISNWTGAVSTDWTNTANWSAGVPTSTFSALIPSSLTNYPVITTTQNVKELTVQAGASLTNNGTLQIFGANTINNGTLSGTGIYSFAGSVAQTMSGTVTVNNLALNNALGVTNNGTLTINNSLNMIAGGISGTAPIFSANLPVTFSGSTTTVTGVALYPSAGNIGKLLLNGSGTLSLSAATTVKQLLLTSGTLNNTSGNITVTDSVFRDNGVLTAAPVYGTAVPVSFVGAGAIPSSYEISPATGGVGSFNITGTGTYTVISTLIANGDLNVNAGIVKMSSNITAYNVSVAGSGTITSDLPASSMSRRTLTVGNGAAGNDATVTINGLLGSATRWSTDGLDMEVSANAKTLNINGTTGTIGIACFRPAANADSRTLDITINEDMFLNRDNGGAANIEPALTLQNGTGSYARTVTIAAGRTVTLRGNGGLHGLKNAPTATDELLTNAPSSTLNQGNCTYIINGTLDLSYIAGSVFNLNTCSFAGNTQSVVVNVKSTGTLKLGNIVKLYTALAGQTANIASDDGGTVIFNSATAQTIVVSTGGGTTPALTFSNLIVNNTNGIVLPVPITITATLIQSLGNLTGSAVVMGGTAAQNIVSNGNSIQTLTINNAANVSGNPSVTGTLIITKGQLTDYSSVSNCNVLFNGSTAQTLNGPTAINNLTINNANGITLAAAPTVNGILTLTAGKLQLANNNLTIWTGGSITATTPLTAYIATTGTGNVKYSATANTAFSLPVGSATSYNPITLTPASATDFYVNVADGNTPALTNIGGTLDVTKTLSRTWNVTATVPSSTIVVLGYLGTTDANAGFDNSGADVALLHKNATAWEYVGTGSSIPVSGSLGYKYATFGGIGSFAQFTVANPGTGAVYNGSTGGSFSDIFRSIANGSYGNAATWQLYDNASATWGTTVATPTVSSTVTIQAGDTVILNAQAGVGTLTIESGAVLKSASNATNAAPIVLSVGKVSSTIRNNGVFGCAIGSAATVGGDGITIAIANNCTSFSLIGTGTTGIGSLYAVAGNNSLTAVIDQNVQFRYSSASGLRTALSLLDVTDATITGSRNLAINAGRIVSLFNNTSCLHGTIFSAAGSYNAQQGNMVYDIQGTLDLKGGSVYVTSSTNAASATQLVKINIGAAGKLIVGGDYNIAKVQATQAVYTNIEDGGLLDASSAAISRTNFYGPSTNTTSGYGANYTWIVTTGSALYKRQAGSGASTETFNVAAIPANGNYATMQGNPVQVGTGANANIDVYAVSVMVGTPIPFTTFAADYTLNRTWTVIPGRTTAPYGTFLKFGFTGGSTDANALYSPTYPSVQPVPDSYEVYAGTPYGIGSTDLLTYKTFTGSWTNLTINNTTAAPVTGTFGTAWLMAPAVIASFDPPYYFILKNSAAPLICH